MSVLLSLIKDGRKPVIGMIQLPALPGSSRYRSGTITGMVDAALAEASVLAEGGVDVLMVQNLGDIPLALHATTPQIAWMTRIATELRARVRLPLGLNFLENDAEAMLAVASAASLDFVRIKIFVGAMMTPFGLESAQAHQAIKGRTQWNAEDVAIFADVHDRTGTPLATAGLEEDIEFAVRLGGADGLVLTGRSHEETMEFVCRGRRVYPQIPILVGGGVKADNVTDMLRVADGVIVSTSLKQGGSTSSPFEPQKVRDFMQSVRASRDGS